MKPVSLSLLLIFASCLNLPPVGETALPVLKNPPPSSGKETAKNTELPTPPAVPVTENGVSGEILSLLERGTAGALSSALKLITENNAENSEFGRVMILVCVTLFDTVYPDMKPVSLPKAFPVKTHIYGKIIAAAQAGVYEAPPQGANDYLSHILPFLAFFYAGSLPKEALEQAVSDLTRAREINASSPLGHYFLGLAKEALGASEEARELYTAALERSADCYGAEVSLARLDLSSGDSKAALERLEKLKNRFPRNLTVAEALAEAYFASGKVDIAEKTVDAALAIQPREAGLLLKAEICLQSGRYREALAALDRYALLPNAPSSGPGARKYLFLKGRVNAEGLRDTAAAASSFRAILRDSGDSPDASENREAALYLARLLLRSKDASSLEEGEALLDGLLAGSGLTSPQAEPLVSLALENAMNRGRWAAAERFLAAKNALSGGASPTRQTLLDAYTIAKNRGDKETALSRARSLYAAFPERGAIPLAEALLDAGQNEEARSFIDKLLASTPVGPERSRCYLLSARLKSGEEREKDLRAALFENPRNIDALTALFRYYHAQGDKTRAYTYLKQALSITPNDPQLLKWQKEYE